MIGFARRIAVFGANGWLGRKIVRTLGAAAVTGVDIAEPKQVAAALDFLKPWTVVNAAGRAGPPSRLRGVKGVPQNIDWCNLNDETRAETFRANVQGPRVLGRECTKRGMRIVHLSSGCLWNEASPHADGAWRETDGPAPVSFYAETKVQGEQALARECGKNNEPTIPRIRLPISGDVCGRNLIMKLRRYREVMDVINSVTVVSSFLFALEKLISKELAGIFHVTNPVPVSHRELMDWYCELVDPSHRSEYEIVPEEEVFRLGRAADGRSSCLLNTSKLRSAGIYLHDSRALVRDCMRALKRTMDESDDERRD